MAGGLVSVERQSRDDDEAGECREEEDRGPEIVPLRLRDLEGLVELLLLVGVGRRVVGRHLVIAGVLVVVRLLVVLLLVGLLLLLLLVWLLLVILLLVRLLLVILLLVGLLLLVVLLLSSIGRAAKELVGGTAVSLLLCHCDRPRWSILSLELSIYATPILLSIFDKLMPARITLTLGVTGGGGCLGGGRGIEKRATRAGFAAGDVRNWTTGRQFF